MKRPTSLGALGQISKIGIAGRDEGQSFNVGAKGCKLGDQSNRIWRCRPAAMRASKRDVGTVRPAAPKTAASPRSHAIGRRRTAAELSGPIRNLKVLPHSEGCSARRPSRAHGPRSGPRADAGAQFRQGDDRVRDEHEYIATGDRIELAEATVAGSPWGDMRVRSLRG